MTSFEKTLGYTFHEKRLLEAALTHSSYANEAPNAPQNNERLEFLGDSVLGFIVSEELYTAENSLPEGVLTRRRAALVCEEALAGFARRLGLGPRLRLGRGEAAGGGGGRPSILADAFEALIAAIYLDGGIEAARAFILPFVRGAQERPGDYKTRLQEWVQQNPGARVEYAVTGEEGPEHRKLFTVEARLEGRAVGSGSGRSKKLAQQQAARQALMRLCGEQERRTP